MNYFNNIKLLLKMVFIISIIGSAGRGDDYKYVTKERYDKMVNYAELMINKLQIPWNQICLKSGGAAFSDHIAITLAMRHKCYLTLHLPVPWDYNNKQYSTQYKDGITSNTYHQQFKQLTGIDSLNDLDFIIQNGALVDQTHKSFKSRNTEVAKCNIMFAFTNGKGDKPGSPGTLDTWNKCLSTQKYYFSLDNILSLSNL